MRDTVARYPVRRSYSSRVLELRTIETISPSRRISPVSLELFRVHFHMDSRSRHIHCGVLSTGAFTTSTSAGNFRSKSESPRPMLDWSDENSKLATLPLTS
mgnify:CR=1 FL=1